MKNINYFEDESGITIWLEDKPEVVEEGENLVEALKNLSDAVKFFEEM